MGNSKMKAPKLLLVLALLGLVSACADAQNNQKKTLGTLLGAGLGALAGSQIGSGKGQLVAVAVGALGGAFLGSELGKSLDEVDRLKANQTQQMAMENNKNGVASAWSNPNSGHSGQVTPTKTYQVATGEHCREYEHEIDVDGKREVLKGTACRQSDGSWRVIN